MFRRLVEMAFLVVLAFVGMGCEDNEGRGELLAGPQIDVHCAGEQKKLPAFPSGGGVGDTNVKVECPPP